MPRLWMVDPVLMCQKHLVAEHHECHVFLGKMKKKQRLDGYISANLFSAHDIWWRHQALVHEMLRRGYKHNSPFPTRREVEALAEYLPAHPILDRARAFEDLMQRGCACYEGVAR